MSFIWSLFPQLLVCIKASWTLSHATATAFLWNDFDTEPILRLRTCTCHNPFLFLIEAILSPPCDRGVTYENRQRFYVNLQKGSSGVEQRTENPFVVVQIYRRAPHPLALCPFPRLYKSNFNYLVILIQDILFFLTSRLNSTSN